MRTRVKSNFEKKPHLWTISIEGYPPLDIHYTELEWGSKWSHMQDNVSGSFSGTRKRHKRPDHRCLHQHLTVKFTAAGSVFPFTHWRYFYPSPLITTDCGLWGEIPFVVPTVPFRPESDFREFLQESVKSFQQQFESKISLANFVIELKDFRGVLERFYDATTQAVASKSAKAVKRAARAEYRDRLNNGIGGNNLDLQLNWRSFVKDVPKLFTFYQEAMDRLELLVGNRRFVDHKRRRFQIPAEEMGDPILLYGMSGRGFFNSLQSSLWLVPKGCQVTYNVSAYMDNALHMDAINLWNVVADKIGLNNSPKIVWNATKLSWVVDFFVDSRSFFDAFEKQAFEGQLTIEGGNVSQKYESTYDLVWSRSLSRITTSLEPEPYEEPIGTVTHVYYERSPLRVSKDSYFALNQSLSSDQQILLGSLIDARMGVSAKVASKVIGLTKALARRYRNRRL